MDDIIPITLSTLKELIMEYGFYQTILGVAFLIMVWRLPNIIMALKDWRK